MSFTVDVALLNVLWNDLPIQNKSQMTKQGAFTDANMHQKCVYVCDLSAVLDIVEGGRAQASNVWKTPFIFQVWKRMCVANSPLHLFSTSLLFCSIWGLITGLYACWRTQYIKFTLNKIPRHSESTHVYLLIKYRGASKQQKHRCMTEDLKKIVSLRWKRKKKDVTSVFHRCLLQLVMLNLYIWTGFMNTNKETASSTLTQGK